MLCFDLTQHSCTLTTKTMCWFQSCDFLVIIQHLYLGGVTFGPMCPHDQGQTQFLCYGHAKVVYSTFTSSGSVVLVCNPFHCSPSCQSWAMFAFMAVRTHCVLTQSQGTTQLEVQCHFPLHPLIHMITNVMQQHHHKFVPLYSCRKWLSQWVCRIFMRVHMGCSPFITCNSLSHKVASNALWFLLESGVWNGGVC